MILFASYIPLAHRFLMLLLLFSFFCMFVHTKKAQTSSCLLTNRGLSIPTKSNKQQETYAGMKTHYILCRCSMDIIIPIGIYRYFGSDLVEKLLSFRFVKRKAQ